ncbi:MAG: hypothetical protein GXO14_04910 [Thermococci archaeon]|nr:hypothetical protein [Thermococci archaeon]
MIAWLPYFFIALISILAAIALTRRLGEGWAWINRKIIHLSIVPSMVFFYYSLLPRYVFSLSALTIGLFQLAAHLRRRELSWYQIEHNYGEVFFALSVAPVSYFLPRTYATALMLAMAISDGVTGIIRHFYFKRHGFNVRLKKHWTGSVAYLLTAMAIALYLLDGNLIKKTLWAAALMIAEYQPWLDDNLAVPLVGSLLFLLY